MADRGTRQSPVNYVAILRQRLNERTAPFGSLADAMTGDNQVRFRRLALPTASFAEQVATWWQLTPQDLGSDFRRLLGACPEFTMGFLDRAKSSSPALPRRPSAVNLNHLSTAKDTIWVGHGLSPTGDTIALLADIGRLSRIGAAIGSKHIHVALAGPQWGSYSIASTRSGVPYPDLHKRVLERQALYRTFGFRDADVDIWDIVTANATGGGAIDLTTLHGQIRDALSLHHALTPDQRALLVAWAEDTRQTAPPLPTVRLFDQELLAFSHSVQRRLAVAIAQALREDLIAIDGAREYLAESSQAKEPQDEALETAMLYLLCQIKMQVKRANTLKIGPETEMLFDAPFNRLADQKSIPLVSVYLKHYEIGPLRVLPYTALSIDVAKSTDWKTAHQALIRLDHGNDLEHIRRTLLATQRHCRARLVADLLSFIVHAIRDRHVQNTALDLTRAVDSDAAEKMSEALAASSATGTVADAFLDANPKDSNIPYWIIPFLWGDENWSQRSVPLATLVQLLIRIASDAMTAA